MHEYHKLKQKVSEILIPRGFVEIKPDTDIDVCGSVHCIYANAAARFMVEWHGEDGYGSVEQWLDEHWQRLKNIVPEGPEPEFSLAIENVCGELRLHV